MEAPSNGSAGAPRLCGRPKHRYLAGLADLWSSFPPGEDLDASLPSLHLCSVLYTTVHIGPLRRGISTPWTAVAIGEAAPITKTPAHPLVDIPTRDGDRYRTLAPRFGPGPELIQMAMPIRSTQQPDWRDLCVSVDRASHHRVWLFHPRGRS